MNCELSIAALCGRIETGRRPRARPYGLLAHVPPLRRDLDFSDHREQLEVRLAGEDLAGGFRFTGFRLP